MLVKVGRACSGRSFKFLPSSCQYSLLVRRGNPSLPPRWPPASRHRAWDQPFWRSCWAYLGLLDRIFRLLGLLVCHPLSIFLSSPLQEPLRTDFPPKSTPTCLQLEGFSEVKRCQDSSKMPTKRSFLKIIKMYQNHYKTNTFGYLEPSKMTQKSTQIVAEGIPRASQDRPSDLFPPEKPNIANMTPTSSNLEASGEGLGRQDRLKIRPRAVPDPSKTDLGRLSC